MEVQSPLRVDPRIRSFALPVIRVFPFSRHSHISPSAYFNSPSCLSNPCLPFPSSPSPHPAVFPLGGSGTDSPGLPKVAALGIPGTHLPTRAFSQPPLRGVKVTICMNGSLSSVTSRKSQRTCLHPCLGDLQGSVSRNPTLQEFKMTALSPRCETADQRATGFTGLALGLFQPQRYSRGSL